MGVTAASAVINVPEYFDIRFGTGSATGNVSVGDWLVYSGQRLWATNAGHTAYWKASAAGVALESNPTYDQAGRTVQNSALRFVREGIIRASANFSGQPALGVGAYPDATGSAAYGVTGATGLGATWQTGVKVSLSGSTAVGGSGVALVVGWRAAGNGGTGQLDLLITPSRPDVY